MKKLQCLTIICLTMVQLSFSQAPEGLNYQSITRDAAGDILESQAVGMQFVLHQSTPAGTAVYTETFSTTTDTNGLVALVLGSGTTTDDFSTLDWSVGPYFLETLVDITGGTTYVSLGTSQLMSVPYALYAKHAADGNWTLDTGNGSIYNSNTGNVGVGTPVPTSKLGVMQTAAVDGILVNHFGAAGNSLELVAHDANNGSSSLWIQNFTDGSSINSQVHSGTSTASNIRATNFGLGDGLDIYQTNTGATGTGLLIDQGGTGNFSRGMQITMDAANPALGSSIFHEGTGSGSFLSLSRTTNPSVASYIVHDGLGAGSYSQMTNAANASTGAIIEHAGIGAGIYTSLSNMTNTSAAMFTEHAGTGAGATIQLTNPANFSAASLLIHAGSGPGQSIQQSGIGSAIVAQLTNAANTSDGITIFHDGTGIGVNSIALQNSFIDQIAIQGTSTNPSFPTSGIGVFGTGGFFGVYGSTVSGLGSYGVFSGGDLGATGAKTFLIDHPQDPENKMIRHYSVESNEVLNMYRGVVLLDANGLAEIVLPDYFQELNINPSYQLTAIGTPTVPYISKEINANSFSIAGEPNTKVSWTVHAQRNDPTLRYYDNNGKNYKQEVIEKPARMKGKYLTPEAYGQDESRGMNYRVPQEKPGETKVIVPEIPSIPAAVPKVPELKVEADKK